MSVFQRQTHLTAGTVIDAENLPHVAVCRTAGVFLSQLRDGFRVCPCQLLHQALPAVLALVYGDEAGHTTDYTGKVGIHIALPRLVDDVKHLDVALTAILLVQFVCRFDAVDFPGCPDAVIGKFHTGIRRDPHKVKCIRVFGHQICTKTFARRQAGSIARLNRKQRCFVFFGKAIEDLAADGQFHTTVAGSTCFYRVLPIQNVAIPCDDGIQKTTLGNDVLLKLLFFLKLQRRNFALELRVNFKLAQFHVGSPFRSFLIYGQWAERSSQTHIVSGNTCRHP